jgi:hypothetical protein
VVGVGWSAGGVGDGIEADEDGLEAGEPGSGVWVGVGGGFADGHLRCLLV